MSPEIQVFLDMLYLWIIGVGAFAATWFVIDYLRTANLRSFFAKTLLLLNGGIAIVLWLAVIRRMFEVNGWWTVLSLIAFTTVDLMLIMQVYLLRKTRKPLDQDE